MKEYGIERAWRDMRLNRIGAGTDEIMLDVIGRSLRAVGAPTRTTGEVAPRAVALLDRFSLVTAFAAVAEPCPVHDEHEELRAEIRRFVAEELRPHAAEWEDARWFPNEVFPRMAELGLLGLKYPEEYGGQGGGYLHDAVLAEELARCGSGGLAAGIGAHIGIATPPVWKFGTEEQKQRYLVPAIRGEKIAALGITEPGAGSDVAGIRTFARRVDGGYVVNGSKTFITNGVRADFVVTAVKTTEEGGHHGISFLIVESEMEGFESRRSSRSSAGTRPTPASSPSTTCSCPTRTCSARRTRAST